MRYLKKFESINIDSITDELLKKLSKRDAKEIKSNIDEILLPLSDLNLRVITRLEYDEYSIISIRIESEWANGKIYPFYWSDIEDDFLRIFDYINNETSGLPDYIPGKLYYKEVQKDGRIFNKNHKDSLYLNDFIDQINKSNNKIYSLSIRLFEYVEYDKNWYKKYE
jgi:hypothetical protein